MRKHSIMTFVIGAIFGTVIFGSSLALAISGQLDVDFAPLKYYFNSVQKYPSEDQQGFIYNGRTYVSLRFMAEAAGLDVEWDENTNGIYIAGGMVSDSVVRTTSGVTLKPYPAEYTTGIQGGFDITVDPAQFSSDALKAEATYWKYQVSREQRITSVEVLNSLFIECMNQPNQPLNCKVGQQLTGTGSFDPHGTFPYYVQVLSLAEDGTVVGYHENADPIYIKI